MSTPDPFAPPSAAPEPATAPDETLPTAPIETDADVAAVPAGVEHDLPEPAIAGDEPAAVPTAMPDLPDQGAVVLETLGRIEARLTESQRLIERQTEVAGNLHAENQKLRGGELRKAQSALVIGVLRVFDDVGQMAAMTEDASARRDLTIVAEALVDVLARSGIEVAAVAVGDPFQSRAHKIIAVEPTPEPAADRTVARVVRPGFEWVDGGVVRVSEVAVFKHTPAPVPALADDDERVAPGPEPAAPADASPEVASAAPAGPDAQPHTRPT